MNRIYKPPRRWSLRILLSLNLFTFALMPALLVMFWMYRNNLSNIHDLSDKLIEEAALHLLVQTEGHVEQVHRVLDGILLSKPGIEQSQSAQALLGKPLDFETLAFSLTRMTREVVFVQMALPGGEFISVRRSPTELAGAVVVHQRLPLAGDDHFYDASAPGDRSRPLLPLVGDFEVLQRPWYRAAVSQGKRTFVPLYPSPFTGDPVLALAQPLIENNATVVGVFAAGLAVDRLSSILQASRISANSVAVLIDENGDMVATSTGEELFLVSGGEFSRLKPGQSADAALRRSFAAVQPFIGKSDPVTLRSVVLDERLDIGGGDAIITIMRPFGEQWGLRWTMLVAAPESDFSAVAVAGVRQIGVWILGILLLSLVATVLFARAFIIQFSRLKRTALSIGSQQVPRADERSRIAEFHELSAALYQTALEVTDNRAQILQQAGAMRAANVELEDRIARRTLALRESREAALLSARAKGAFLATMSHEIRTPLNGVVGMADLLEDTPLTREQRDYLHTIRVSSDQLLNVINDILDYSKIESGNLELESEPLSLRTTLEEACEMNAVRARAKGLEMLIDVENNVPEWVGGDITRLRQVLLNFINNAVKFTEKGEIIVSLRVLEEFSIGSAPDAGALLEFRVKDTGIGIAADRVGALFQSFVQVDAATTRRFGGTGLGLAISKRLSEAMGGNVGVESEVGQGSQFWFTARLNYADTPDRSSDSMFRLASLEGKHVLVLDDLPTNLRILDRQLKRWRLKTTLFERPQEALDWLADNPVDAILTDMNMPQMNGLAFAREVRARDPNAYLVLLSSVVVQKPHLGVFAASLLKPYRQAQLFDALIRMTGVTELEQADVAKPPVAAKNQRILVADDNPVNLKVAVAMLAKLGYDMATATNGREALDRVIASLARDDSGQVRPYAAVLMDVNMPVLDGMQATLLINERFGVAAPPVIALSASVLKEDRRRCGDVGMVGFLPKPLRLDELAMALTRYAVTEGEGEARANAAADGADSVFASAAALPALSSSLVANAFKSSGGELTVLMDWSRLEQFRDFDDDMSSITRQVIRLFVDDAPNRMRDIRAALASTDSAALSSAGHALKGAAANVGAHALNKACMKLEQSCLEGQWPADAQGQVDRLVLLTDATRRTLKEWLGVT